jgi:membrane protein implicated in regulation of membrane protease activity
MPLLGALYATHPELVWLLLAAICLIVELLTGTGRLVWPAIAAAAVSLLNVAHIHLGWGAELVLWAIASLGLGFGLGRLISSTTPDATMDHALSLNDEATTNAETPMADEFAKPEAMAARE